MYMYYADKKEIASLQKIVLKVCVSTTQIKKKLLHLHTQLQPAKKDTHSIGNKSYWNGVILNYEIIHQIAAMVSWGTDTVINGYSEVSNLHYIVTLGKKGLKIFTISWNFTI